MTTRTDQYDLGACPAAQASAAGREQFGSAASVTKFAKPAPSSQQPVQTPWGREQEAKYVIATSPGGGHAGEYVNPLSRLSTGPSDNLSM